MTDLIHIRGEEFDRRQLANDVLCVINQVAQIDYRTDTKPSVLILSGNPVDVTDYCANFAGFRVADGINQFGLGIHVVSGVTRYRNYYHCYLVDPTTCPSNDLLIDPTAGQFFETIPGDLREIYFAGSMFLGTRQELRRVVLEPAVQLLRVKPSVDREFVFRRAWGNNSKQFPGIF